MSRKLCFLLLTVCLALQATGQSDLLPGWPGIDGPVSAIVHSRNRIYVAGSFTAVGTNTPYGAALSTSSALPGSNYAKPNNFVNCSTPDGNGGWYIGGTFTMVGGQNRNRIAHIKPDGSLDMSWNPDANSSVAALALSGNTLYVAGSFSVIGGQARNYIAALDAVSGQVTAWNPNANSTVQALALSGTTLYAGGYFTSIGGKSRNRIAALDIGVNTNNATNWDPGANNAISALAISGNTVYAGGIFTNIGGQARNYIAAIDATVNTNNATSWDPNASSTVAAIAISGSTIYAGGGFASIGGQSRSNLAALDATINTNNATAWNPAPNSFVSAIAISGNTVYAGGSFSSIGGQSRSRIAALDATTNTNNATAWNPNASNQVITLSVSGNTVYAGGYFVVMNSQTRNRLAAFDAETGELTSWNPNANTNVSALILSGGQLYAGGAFTTIGALTRNHIAAIDTSTGIATSWNPNITGSNVGSFAIYGNTLYVGGNFSAVNGGTARNRMAAFDMTTGTATAWNPNSSAASTILALAVSGDGTTVYAGGNFSTLNGGSASRRAIAALNASTGTVTSWTPNPSSGSIVNSLLVSGNTLYVGGDFTSMGGQLRSRLAAFDIPTGTVKSWNPSPNNTVFSLAISGTNLYVGAYNLSSIGGLTRSGPAAVDTGTGNVTSWGPNITYSLNPYNINAIATSSLGIVYLGGSFNGVDGNMVSNIAAINTPTVWTGALSTDWFNTGNWQPAIVPAASTPVEIPGNRTNYPVLTSLTATCKNLTIASGAAVTISGGELQLTGSLTNNGTFSNPSGTLNLNGTSAQTIPALSVADLTVNNSEGVTLAGNVSLTGTLRLTNGIVATGNYNLTAASASGGSSVAYVKTNGTGVFKLNVPNSNTGVLYPVGNSSYNPVTLTNSASGTTDNFSVRVADDVLTGGSSGTTITASPAVKRTWFISEEVPGGSDITMTLQWNSGEDRNRFNYQHVYVMHHDGSNWENYGVDPATAPTATGYPGAGPYTATMTGISSFSPFGVGAAPISSLPIRLSAITAANKGKVNHIEWTTETETPGDAMLLQRSSDAQSYETIASIKGNGHSSAYRFDDGLPFKGINYYRLKMTDAGGGFSYSNTVSAFVKEDNAAFTYYPNPVTDKLVVTSEEGRLTIADKNGTLLRAYDLRKGTQDLSLQSLPPGWYIIRFVTGQDAKSYKLLKQ